MSWTVDEIVEHFACRPFNFLFLHQWRDNAECTLMLIRQVNWRISWTASGSSTVSEGSTVARGLGIESHCCSHWINRRWHLNSRAPLHIYVHVREHVLLCLECSATLFLCLSYTLLTFRSTYLGNPVHWSMNVDWRNEGKKRTIFWPKEC